MIRLIGMIWLGYGSVLVAQEAPKLDSKIQELIVIQKGDLPIILSAPHGGRKPIPHCPLRKGDGIAQFATVLDTNTAELTEKLAKRLEQSFKAKPWLVIARFERKYLDVNRPAEAAYESDHAKPLYDAYHTFLKDACATVQKEWGRGILIDLHGQGATANGIYRGTRDFKTVKLLEERFGRAAVVGEKSLLGQLVKKNYQILPPLDSKDRETKFNGGHIVFTYGSHQGSGIDAIQLELGSQARSKANLERTANDLAEAIEVFAAEYLPREKTKR